MAVKRIVANINVEEMKRAKSFYQDMLGLEELMDFGWIVTYGNKNEMTVQISIATEGGSGAITPDLSIEVDNLDEMYQRFLDSDFEVVYNITNEPWGVRRFFVKDPFGKVVNILTHIQ